MKKLLQALCFICVLIISLFAVACNATSSTENAGGTGGGTNTSGRTDGGNSGNSSGGTDTSDYTSEYVEVEQSIADSITYDFSALSSNTAIPEDAETVAASASKLSLSGEAVYVLSGEYSGGITVSADKDVHIYLNGATITNSGKKALTIEKGDTEEDISVIITVVSGTVNEISNTDSKNAFDSALPTYINGSGTLNVSSTGNNAIKVDAHLKIVDATVNVTDSANNALSAYSLSAKDCTINVSSAAKDGIHAEMDDSVTAWTTEDGYVVLFNVNYTCSVEGDGIQADTFVYVEDGTYNIETNATFVSYAEWQASIDDYEIEEDDFRYSRSGNETIGYTYTKKSSKTITNSNITSLYAMKQGTKGIKVGEIDYDVVENGETTEITVNNGNYYIIIDGGTFTINSSDDAIHANSGNVTINGGTFTIETLDDGITADVLVNINGGDITVNKCFEGIEGGYVVINGGTIKLTCADDGINAASDDFTNEYIRISGGTVVIDAEGDGIDSNGTATITGGTVYVFGPTSGGNSALDSESSVVISGGTVLAISKEAMDSITFGKPYVSASISISANSTISIDGVVSFVVPKAYSGATVIICSENMTANTSYKLSYGSGSVSLTAKTGSTGGMGGGMQGGGSFAPGGMGGRRP